MRNPIESGTHPARLPRLSRRRFLVGGASVAGLLLLQACGGQKPASTSQSSSSASSAANGGSAGGSTAATAAASPSAGSAANLTPKKGGTIKVVIIGEPPVLADGMYTTNFITTDITAQIYEGLYAKGANYDAKPMLLDTAEVSSDGLTYTFHLRQGVKFHNGNPFTADDVVASLNRWGVMTGRGKVVFGVLADQGLKATDTHTVTMTLKSAFGALPIYLSRLEAFMMPKEVATSVGTQKIPDDKVIGTGPFMLKKHVVDQYIKLAPFPDYAARTDAPDGLAGKKVVYIDELDIIPVPNLSVATSGMITGEYQFARDVDNNQYDKLKANSDLNVIVNKAGGWICVNYNKKHGPLTNLKLRQAISMCFDRQQTLIAAYAIQDLTRMEPSIATPETHWYSTAGDDIYKKVDLDEAKKLVQESGYDGTPLRWITTKQYAYHYNTAAYVKQGMEKIGLKCELVVSDWPTVVERRADPTQWEIIVAGLSGSWFPATQLFNDPTWPGFWVSDPRDKLVAQMDQESDPAKLKQIIDQYQTLVYTDLPFMKIGDDFAVHVVSKKIANYNPTTANSSYAFWNCWLA